MKILLIDNNDSFTYNLFHLIKSVCAEEDIIDVRSRDDLQVGQVSGFDRIIISPGPGIPSETSLLSDIIKSKGSQIPILGICLGHQAIAESYGAQLYNLPKPMHGVRTDIEIRDHSNIFRGTGQTLEVGRYHSWQVSSENFPECLDITAADTFGNIMALSHREYDVHGVQFHPESFMTQSGDTIIRNFIHGDR